MPTSSQSQILSVVDYQLLQQQAQQQQQQQQQQIANSQDATTKLAGLNYVNQPSLIEIRRRSSRDERRPSTGKKDNDGNQSPPPPNITVRRRSSAKIIDDTTSNRPTQQSDSFRMPTIYLNHMSHNELKTPTQSSRFRRISLNDDNGIENEHKSKQLKSYPTPTTPDDENNALSSDDNEENFPKERRSSLLNDNARRLLILGTIRPSRTFYKDLPEDDVEHLMEYFRRMRKTHRTITSEEINQELQNKFIEYKPKIFFDSATVTKGQIMNIEKIIEQYADKIRTNKAELVKLENPIRFVIKQIDNDIPLTTIPREYHDCFLTLVTRSDPLRKSDLINELIRDKLIEDVKANSLDISYFPGGINYDVPREDIDESGHMKIETYQKLKKRLSHRKIWHFSEPPEKKPNALLANLPLDFSIYINHQYLLDCLYDHLKTLSFDENFIKNDQILSIEFVPLSCILNSDDIQNQFIIDCDSIETKDKLMEKPLKISLNKQTSTIELRSYDYEIHREYEKSIKAEKYRELIKNHEEAIKRTSTK
ncbi:unnamed protein product [Rotaria sordida]|uniref:Uncharacterized protein n=1 Tax=Rotaria sordida TaxID=392033 RepID=A0A819NWG8_9BILA|nr:unnamed protein product [Rotaria sordida]CAF1152678.1 unnamed protein product [Rotaria sordida]CAF1171244.1 unnamed protein product [Rotaria sordida]CAF1234924.1 unnamed protein product [Rotaria sordida]CAF3739723.1 unnamed protein product [Rotaria sordida]